MNEFKLGPKQEKWLQALESGEYKQGKIYLKDTKNQFCCLGVANEVLELGESDCSALQNTYEQIGLRSEMGRLNMPYGRYSRLTSMNDDEEVGITFKEIAAYIRANPENVFTESK